MFFRAITSVTVIIVFSLFVVPSVSAHAAQPRVEISVERLNPGGVVNVRGVSFGMDDVVTLTLLGSNVETPLGEVTADGEGEFLQIVVLPTDLTEGIYYIRATTSHHQVISPPLTVWGMAMVEGGGQGERDEDDGLLAPMPTYAPGVSSTAMPQAAANEAVAESNRTPNISTITFVVVTVILAAFGVRFLIKR